MTEFSIERYGLNPSTDKLCINVKEIVDSIKRSDINPLDLIVRECVQNSIDSAVEPNNNRRFVSVDFLHKQFNGRRFLSFLGRESNSAFSNFLGSKLDAAKLLAVRDTGTTGVDGDYDDKNSNVFKLVAGFLNGKTKAPNESTLGGSHGAGKTVVLKEGIGLVVYYTNTRNHGSRLWVYYCQNSAGQIFDKGIRNDNEKFLPCSLAWWGIPRRGKTNSVQPVTDMGFIREVLRSLNLPEFEAEEYGTVIAIPFIDERKMLKGIQACNTNVTGASKSEGSLFETNQASVRSAQITILQYIENAVAKWYAPRLSSLSENPMSFKYPWGPSLLCSFIDDTQTTLLSGANPDFSSYKLIQKMFQIAVAPDVPDSQGQIGPEPFKITIERGKNRWRGAKFDFADVRNIGVLVVVKLPSHSEFDELFDGIDRDDSIVYARSPGLVLSYDDPDWSACLRKYPRLPGEKLFGVFVPNVKNQIIPEDHSQFKTVSLEVPFRESEGFDHGKWPKGAQWPEDDEGGDIAYRIIGHVIDRITWKVGELAKVIDQEKKEQSRHSVTIGSLWGKFFGTNGAGVKGTRAAPGGNCGRDSRNNPVQAQKHARHHDTKLELFTPEYSLDSAGKVLISVPYKLVFGRKRTPVSASLTVRIGSKSLSYDEWQKDLDKRTTAEAFPARFCEIRKSNGISAEFCKGDSEVYFTYNGQDSHEGAMVYVLSREVVCELKIDFYAKEEIVK